MSDEYMTTEQVCGVLKRAGVDDKEVSQVWSARIQPQRLTDKEKKFVLGVKAPAGQAFLIVYRMGLGRPLVKNDPLDESGPDWRPRWISVEGPITMDDVNERAKELTSE